MSDLRFVFVGNALGRVRRVTASGRQWLVAPVTSIVGDSVLPGSQGPLFYPSDECARNYAQWDGIPITAYHPMTPDGSPVGATFPGVLKRQGIGVVRDTLFNGKLRHQAWIDVARAKAADPYTNGAGTKILNALEAGQAVEVSTGLYTDNESQQGYCPKGRGYTAIARNYVADHLAILPDQKGACSVQDGCGLLVNAKDAKGHGSEKHGGVEMSVKGIPAPRTRKTKLSKLNIDQADAKLRETGHSLTGKGHFDLASMTAHYEVQHPDGSRKMLPVSEIAKLVGNSGDDKKNGCGDGG